MVLLHAVGERQLPNSCLPGNLQHAMAVPTAVLEQLVLDQQCTAFALSTWHCNSIRAQ